MKKPKQTASDLPANDNAPIRAAVETMDHGQEVLHVYVQPAQKHEPESQAGTRARGTWKPTCVYTDLPQTLPLMPEEIALIRGYMGDLVGRILANDNEPV